MAESVTVTNMPDSGSHERVAHDLWLTIRFNRPKIDDWKARAGQDLELYVQCLNAARNRTVDLSKLT